LALTNAAAFDPAGSAAGITLGGLGGVSTGLTITINGTAGTLNSNLNWTIPTNGGGGVVSGDYVSNGLATVNGQAISNGAAITITAGAGLVDSVNGYTGVVVLAAGDVGAVATNDAGYIDATNRATWWETYEPEPMGGLVMRLRSDTQASINYLFLNQINANAFLGNFQTATGGFARILNDAALEFGQTAENRFRFVPNGGVFPLMQTDSILGWIAAYIPTNALDATADQAYRNPANMATNPSTGTGWLAYSNGALTPAYFGIGLYTNVSGTNAALFKHPNSPTNYLILLP
jgi:hypothetical protein